ncbi:MAG: hypothetical protein CBD74_15365 [Saprospirales bacterium TMED214]|nr:MAG: hypothetical protein CBD74_15365 [Saprospirales bacterium TMED214]
MQSCPQSIQTESYQKEPDFDGQIADGYFERRFEVARLQTAISKERRNFEIVSPLTESLKE